MTKGQAISFDDEAATLMFSFFNLEDIRIPCRKDHPTAKPPQPPQPPNVAERNDVATLIPTLVFFAAWGSQDPLLWWRWLPWACQELLSKVWLGEGSCGSLGTLAALKEEEKGNHYPGLFHWLICKNLEKQEIIQNSIKHQHFGNDWFPQTSPHFDVFQDDFFFLKMPFPFQIEAVLSIYFTHSLWL